MAYNFLGLVNEICEEVNEVPLTSSNFSTATGFYSHAKNSVNRTLRTINTAERFWPFNHATYPQTLTAGTMRYSFPASVRVIDMDSFRIAQNDVLGNETVKLKLMDYDEYLNKYLDHEYDTGTTRRNLPKYVVKTNAAEYLVFPNPDQAYNLKYEYYSTPSDLSAYDDVPSIPEKYRNVVHDGAMIWVYSFREDEENKATATSNFKEGLKDMRSIEINREIYVRSGMLETDYTGNKTVGYRI